MTADPERRSMAITICPIIDQILSSNDWKTLAKLDPHTCYRELIHIEGQLQWSNIDFQKSYAVNAYISGSSTVWGRSDRRSDNFSEYGSSRPSPAHLEHLSLERRRSLVKIGRLRGPKEYSICGPGWCEDMGCLRSKFVHVLLFV